MTRDYRQLPDDVLRICHSVDAPPRLVAHLTLVHDVAYQLLDRLEDEFPALVLDRDAVIFGSATHDIGKSLHTSELSAPGRLHERDGAGLLSRFGATERLSRFTRTHANWGHDPEIAIEDLLVALADN